LQCAQVVKHCEWQPTSKKKRKEKSFTYSKTYFTMPRKNRTSHGAQYALIAHHAELELTATAVMNNSLVKVKPCIQNILIMHKYTSIQIALNPLMHELYGKYVYSLL